MTSGTAIRREARPKDHENAADEFQKCNEDGRQVWQRKAQLREVVGHPRNAMQFPPTNLHELKAPIEADEQQK